MDGTVDNVAGAAGQADASRCVQVTLADGSVLPLAGLSRQDLLTLQWQQEQQFAAQILAAPKGSPERAEVLRHAYDTVTQLFAAAQGLPRRAGPHGSPPAAGAAGAGNPPKAAAAENGAAALRDRLLVGSALGAGGPGRLPDGRHRGFRGHAPPGPRIGSDRTTPRGSTWAISSAPRSSRPRAPLRWSTGTTSSSTSRRTRSSTTCGGSTSCWSRADS